MSQQPFDRNVTHKTSLLEFVPDHLLAKLEGKTHIEFGSQRLKVSWMYHLINSIITRYYFSESAKMNISSEITRHWYGTYYNFYLQYLAHEGFLKLTTKYYVGSKCNTYELNVAQIAHVTRRRNDDKTILKKWKAHFLMNKVRKQEHTRIDRGVKHKLVQDFLTVKVDYLGAVGFLKNSYAKNLMTPESFKKNKLSVDCIHDGSLFHTEDEYGRFHTNLTVLKKHIRNNYLTIDGLKVGELDIQNSQPFFLSAWLRKHGVDKMFPDEFARYDQQVRDGVIYETIAAIFNCNRDRAKKILYLVMFGKSNMAMDAHQQFYVLFPGIWQYIANTKRETGNHKLLAHDLQRMESDVVYNKICARLQAEQPHVRIFTVHDSLFFGEKYRADVERIFYEELKLV